MSVQQLATVSPSTALAVAEAATFSSLSQDEQNLIKEYIHSGDFSKIPPARIGDVYVAYCRYIGVDPMERPFDLLKDRNGTKLYANSACAAALCRTRNISCKTLETKIVTIAGFEFVMSVTEATVTDGNGNQRTMTGTGMIPLGETETKWDPEVKRKVPTGNTLKATQEAVAVKWMHCETKSMRRAVLRTVGLGVSDFSDAPSGSRQVEVEAREGKIIVRQEALPEVATEDVEESAQELLVMLSDIRGVSPEEVWNHVCRKLGVPDGVSVDSLSEPKQIEALELLSRWSEKAASEQSPASLDAP